VDEEYARRVKWNAKSWVQRYQDMGDLAESKFNLYCYSCGISCVQFGWERPELEHFGWLPLALRYMPDRLVEIGSKHIFVEVKGCGKDGTIKIKEENLKALEYWKNLLPVRFFFYNSSTDRSCFNELLTLENMRKLSCSVEKSKFEDNQKDYFLFSVTNFEPWN
jgi:hypothetical protein